MWLSVFSSMFFIWLIIWLFFLFQYVISISLRSKTKRARNHCYFFFHLILNVLNPKLPIVSTPSFEEFRWKWFSNWKENQIDLLSINHFNCWWNERIISTQPNHGYESETHSNEKKKINYSSHQKLNALNNEHKRRKKNAQIVHSSSRSERVRLARSLRRSTSGLRFVTFTTKQVFFDFGTTMIIRLANEERVIDTHTHRFTCTLAIPIRFASRDCIGAMERSA